MRQFPLSGNSDQHTLKTTARNGASSLSQTGNVSYCATTMLNDSHPCANLRGFPSDGGPCESTDFSWVRALFGPADCADSPEIDDIAYILLALIGAVGATGRCACRSRIGVV